MISECVKARWFQNVGTISAEFFDDIKSTKIIQLGRLLVVNVPKGYDCSYDEKNDLNRDALSLESLLRNQHV